MVRGIWFIVRVEVRERRMKPSEKVVKREKVFETGWFDVIAKTVAIETLEGEASGTGQTLPQESRPYYSLQLADYAAIVPLTENGELLLVRQYRPAVERHTLEIPSGLVETGEDPATTAERELLEETGYRAIAIDFLGCVTTNPGRLENRMWCYFTTVAKERQATEEGIEIVLAPLPEVAAWLRSGEFDTGLHMAPLLLALLQSKFSLPNF